MSKLLVMFEIENADFGTLMSAIAPHMPAVENLSVSPARIAGPVKPAKKPRPPESPLRSLTKSRTMRLAMDILTGAKGKPVEFAEMAKSFAACDLSPNSVSAAISHLAKHGLIERVSRDAVRLKEPGI